MAYPDFAYDVYENFEDASLASGLTLIDTTSAITLPSSTQHYMGSNSMAVDLAGLAAQAQINYDGISSNNISFGFWFRTGSYGNWDGGPTIINAQNDGYGNLIRIADERNAGSNDRQLAGEGGTVAVSDYTWYWITVQYNRNATSYWRVYDATNALVGTQQSFTAPDYAVDNILFGSWAADFSCIIYFDDLVIDRTDATFPLLGWETGTPPGSPTGTQIPIIVYNLTQQGFM